MKKLIFAIFTNAMLTLWMVTPAHAARIMDTDTVVQAMSRGAILLDIREADAYHKGHIPGAVNLGPHVCSQLRTPVSSDYIPVDRITSIAGTLGVDPGKEIIAYADKGSACPYFILVSLELVGAKNAHVYHGGIDEWKTAGRPIATTVTTLPQVTLDLHLLPGIIVSTYEVNASLADRKIQMLDVRTPNEFVGMDVRALRGGHIPHAVNIPYEQNWIDPESLIKVQKKQVANNDGFALKTREDLKQVYAKLDPALETIVYCQNGARASVTATVLRDLGFRDVRVYDPSWAGYGNHFDLPAENETFFDMFALTNRIGTMQQRIDMLEKRLDDLKAKRK